MDAQTKAPVEEQKSPQELRSEMIENIRKIIGKARICFLSNLSGRQLVSRPMYIQGTDFDGDLWFFTRRDSEKMAELKKDSRVSVSFSEKAFVSVSGRLEVVENELKKQKLWTRAMETFFGCPVEDPGVVLLRVQAETAQYWENTGSLGGLIKKVQSLDESQHSSVEL